MNLPFSPTFFRKIDIFQQLMEYESQKEKKHLWEGEKALLIWGASDQHQNLGSALGTNHVKDALTYCVENEIIPESEKIRLRNNLRHILDTIPVHEFGHYEDTADPRSPSVKISRNGILAGEILLQTDFLKKTWRYKIWTFLWWIILGAAGVILLSQTLSAVSALLPLSKVNEVRLSNNQHKHNLRRQHPSVYFKQ